MSEELPLNYRPNYDYFLDVSDGDTSFLIEILEIFISQTPGQLEEMKELIQVKDWQTIKELAHKVKASFRMLGLAEIASIWNDIENYTQDNLQQHKIEESFTSIYPLIKKLIAIIIIDRDKFLNAN